MTTEDEILKELREHTRLKRAELGLLSEIKFELQNTRKLSQLNYTISLPKKKGFIQTVRERIRLLLKRE